MTVVSFTDYRPLPRFDGIPWNRVRVEESASASGPWTILSTTVLNPIDGDPEEPMSRSFTVANAVLDHGWYRISFLDANNNIIIVDPPVFNAKNIAWRASLGDLGQIMMGRTADDVGVKQGTFNNKTQPNDTQAAEMIEKAVQDIAPRIGTDIPPDLIQDAQNVVALRAAMFTELSYFGSEVATQRSPYPQYKELFDEALGRLQTSIAAEEAGQDPTDELSGGQPAYGFPPADDLLTREM